MRLIRWLKKEIDGKRRQSAPPLNYYYDPNSDRKEYLEKLEKFNSFRQKQQHHQQQQPQKLSTHDNDLNLEINYKNELDDEWKPENITSNNIIDYDQLNDQNNDHYNSFNFEDELQKLDKIRQSLPAFMSKTYLTKSFRRNANKNKLKPINNNNTIITEKEIENFEENYCNVNNINNISIINNDAGLINSKIYDDCIVNSPPEKFFHQNSNPYEIITDNINGNGVNNNIIDRYATPIKPPRKMDEMRQRKSFPTPNSNTPTSDGNRKSLKKSRNNSEVKNQRISPPYETIINRHGDRVEYALPYSSDDTVSDVCTRRTTTATKDKSPNQLKCEQIVCESYEFLNDMDTDDNGDSGVSFLGQKRSNVIITDLDKSLDSCRTLDRNTLTSKANSERDNILSTLSELETFSQSLAAQSSNSFLSKDENCIIVCKQKDIKTKTSVLRSTFNSPLDFSSGIYRKNIVTLRKFTKTRRSTDCNSDLAEEAIQRDYEILSQIRHSNIVLLMAASINKKLLSHMTLVLEPTDYTLNYYLFQMNEKLSLFESISIVQQISMATLYLHECGYIHSNISTHCILVRKHPWCCKLSSFDLTTNISTKNIRNEIETTYCSTTTIKNDSSRLSLQIPIEKTPQKSFKSSAALHQKYKKISKLLPNLHNTPNRSIHRTYIGVPSKYWQYNIEYRRHLSLHFYQAPELLTSATDSNYVFPTKSSDVYGLTLLLWECLNYCVPYAIYNAIELEQLFIGRNLTPLPIFEHERCQLFENIFQMGLVCDPTKRNINLEHFISLLEDIKFQLNDNDNEVIQLPKKRSIAIESSDCEYESLDSSEMDKKEKKLSKRNEYRRNLYANTTASLFIDKPLPSIPITSDNNYDEVFDDTTLYQSLLNFNKCLTDRKNSDNIERTSTLKRSSVTSSSNEKLPKKSSRALFDQTSKPTINSNTFQLLNDNLDAIDNCNSNNQFARNAIIEEFKQNQINTNKSNGNGNSIIGPLKIKKIDLPKLQNTTQCQIQQFKENTNTEQSSDNDPEKVQIVGWKVKEDQLKSQDAISNSNSKSLNSLIADANSLDNNLTTSQTEHQSINNNIDNNEPSKAYKFSIDNYSLPTTPIALKNKIRRNTWLSSSQRSPASPFNRLQKQPTKNDANKSTASDQEQLDDTKNKKLNISIRIVHNKITPTKSINEAEDEHDSLISPRFFDKTKLVPEKCDPFPNESVTQSNNNDTTIADNELSKTFHEIVKKSSRYANGESISPSIQSTKINNNSTEIFQKAMEIQQKSKTSQNGHFQNKLWKHEKSICDQSPLNKAFMIDDSTDDVTNNVIIPERLSVKEQIKQFESIDDSCDNTKNGSKLMLTRKNADNSSSATTTCDRKTLIKQTIYRESIVSGEIDLKQLDAMFNTATATSTSAPSNRKMTTLVTLNLRKSHRRLSDIGINKHQINNNMDNNVRHSICGVGDGIDGNLINYQHNKSMISNALAVNSCYRSLDKYMYNTKYICCNCKKQLHQNEMLSINSDNFGLQSSTNQLSIATATAFSKSSNLGSDLSLMHTCNSSTNSTLKRVRPNSNGMNTKSTEDLYIDDDYCHGLDANMELVELDDIVATNTLYNLDDDNNKNHI